MNAIEQDCRELIGRMDARSVSKFSIWLLTDKQWGALEFASETGRILIDNVVNLHLRNCAGAKVHDYEWMTAHDLLRGVDCYEHTPGDTFEEYLAMRRKELAVMAARYILKLDFITAIKSALAPRIEIIKENKITHDADRKQKAWSVVWEQLVSCK